MGPWLSRRFRSHRDRHLRAIIERCPRRGEYLEIIDLGGRTDYWRRLGFDFLQQHKVRITLTNLRPQEIARAGLPEGMFTFATGNACQLDYPDGAFDLSHSNSVIEHVGSFEDMRQFASESARVARHYYVQTPNYWFPIDPHFWRVPLFHWLPLNLRARLLCTFAIASGGRCKDMDHGRRDALSSRLLSGQQMRDLFADGRLTSEKVLGLTKSHLVTR